MAPRKQATGRGKKRVADGEGGSSPLSVKVARMTVEGSSWRASTIKERDLLRHAFLGIRPHFYLFHHLFRLKPQLDEDNPALVGGAGVQLRDKALYLEFSTLSSLSGWHAQWFYIGNHKPSLPGRDNAPPQRQECWLKKPTEEESRDIPELMKWIYHLKDQRVTGESMAYSFIECRIQPLQQRVHLGFEYEGTQDPSCMAPYVPSAEEVMRRVTRLFTGVTSEPYVPRLFGADYSPNPGDLERFRSDPPEPVFEEVAQDTPAAGDASDVATMPLRTKRVATRKRSVVAAAATPSSREEIDTEEKPELPRQGLVDLTGERSPLSGQTSPATGPRISTLTGNKTAPRGLVVPTTLPLRKPPRKSKTPAAASSSTIQAGTRASSQPKEPVAVSTAEPSVDKDVPASTGGRDLEPPTDAGVQPENEAPGNIPGANTEDSAQVGK
ncbi:retrotransposon protein, putative, Ty3-gypsy subclass [Panicum miliaceum]|uniref:Retrotransposon protein, putative, Ty3-gypsy subclass n=1 Tax=Panicum miliaceum TaxID=4540 RepID=A0A3L6SUY0_PANMI|nr:retrotransposon protein, putative, Ty3-gypsy subclass [Panicum miliaceum]